MHFSFKSCRKSKEELHSKCRVIIAYVYLHLFIFIEFIKVILVHKAIQFSSVQLNKTSCTHCIVHPSPQVKSLSVPIYPPLWPPPPPQPPFPFGFHYTAVSICYIYSCQSVPCIHACFYFVH